MLPAREMGSNVKLPPLLLCPCLYMVEFGERNACRASFNCDSLGVIGVVEADPPLRWGIAATGWLFPVLLPSEGGQVEIVVRPEEQIVPARVRRVRVKEVLAVAQEDTHPRDLAVVRRDMEVGVKVAAVRGEPRNGPVHTGLEWLTLRQWCMGDDSQ